MMQFIALLISGILIDNVILSRFLGTCPFLGVSNQRSSAIGMGLAVTFVVTLSSVVAWLINTYILQPFDMTYMGTIIFILVIASLVQIIEMFIKKASPGLYRALGIYLPLITTNCAVLGLATIVTGGDYTFIETLVYSFASGFGFFVIIFIFSNLRERIQYSPVPQAFKGIPIALMTAGILAMIVSRFAGI